MGYGNTPIEVGNFCISLKYVAKITICLITLSANIPLG